MKEQIHQLLQLHPDKKIHNYQFSMNAVIGRGAYGVVYAGRTLDTGQPVALKVVPLQQMSQESFKLLQKEIDIMKDLDSQNVVKLIDVVRTGNNYYLVSELCTCGDLKEYMKSTGAIEEKQALSIIIQILKGILQSFKRGIIHRDLKPANILLTQQQGQLLFKIADFGFAKRFDHLENDLMTSLVGTPLYMSPQVLLRRQYTAKCDVWSIGLIYYELLEGKTPWNVKDILDLINKQRCTRITFSKKISKQSQQFILGCISYEENNRFSWENVFTHPVFEGTFEKNQQQHDTKRSISQIKNTSQPQIAFERKDAQTKFSQKSVSPKQMVKVNAKGNLPASVQKQTMRSPIQVNNKLGSKLNSENRIGFRTIKSEYVDGSPIQQFENIQKDRTSSTLATLSPKNFHSGQDIFIKIIIVTNSEIKTYTNIHQNKYGCLNTNILPISEKLIKKRSTPIIDYGLKNSNIQIEYSKKENFQVESFSKERKYTIQKNSNYLTDNITNTDILKNHLDYLLVLKQLKDQLRDLFNSQLKISSIVAKLSFVLSKHAMIKSNEVKVQMIDKGLNCLDLYNFDDFKKSDQFLNYEKPIVEQHFEIFGLYHQNFLEINEVLSLVIGDQDFQEIFNNFFQPTLHFARFAHQISYQFIQENLKDLLCETYSHTFQSFANAMLLYSYHMRNHQFTQSEQNKFIYQLRQNNPMFLKKYETLNIDQIRKTNFQILDTLKNNFIELRI